MKKFILLMLFFFVSLSISQNYLSENYILDSTYYVIYDLEINLEDSIWNIKIETNERRNIGGKESWPRIENRIITGKICFLINEKDTTMYHLLSDVLVIALPEYKIQKREHDKYYKVYQRDRDFILVYTEKEAILIRYDFFKEDFIIIDIFERN
jgi:hypothetical protein